MRVLRLWELVRERMASMLFGRVRLQHGWHPHVALLHLVEHSWKQGDLEVRIPKEDAIRVLSAAPRTNDDPGPCEAFDRLVKHVLAGGAGATKCRLVSGARGRLELWVEASSGGIVFRAANATAGT